MKLLSKLVLIASTFAAAGGALAQDQSAFFAMQRMVSDGYYATHPSTTAKQETTRTAHAS
ncbi:MAG TPA: hypothetical protein VEQ87_24565 [Burkholderiales bacterium]|nr:hypothetical protein [Burkholderiales bacterium]